jgi:hypothetical protein
MAILIPDSADGINFSVILKKVCRNGGGINFHVYVSRLKM